LFDVLLLFEGGGNVVKHGGGKKNQSSGIRVRWREEKRNEKKEKKRKKWTTWKLAKKETSTFGLSVAFCSFFFSSAVMGDILFES